MKMNLIKYFLGRHTCQSLKQSNSGQGLLGTIGCDGGLACNAIPEAIMCSVIWEFIAPVDKTLAYVLVQRGF